MDAHDALNRHTNKKYKIKEEEGIENKKTLERTNGQRFRT